MKPKTTVLLMVVLLFGIAASGADSRIAEKERVAESLQPIMGSLTPAPEIKTNDSSTLTISYLTQTFKVHGGSMTGEFAREAHDETGPTFKGFILCVQVQPKGEVNQGMTPQTLRRPYWLTDIDVTPVGGSDKQLFWGLSYGSRTDTNILGQIRQKIEEFRTPPASPFTVELKGPEDSAVITTTGRTCVVAIASKSGIGRGKLARTGPSWPSGLTLRFRLKNLELFTLRNGIFHFNTSLRGPLETPYWKDQGVDEQAGDPLGTMTVMKSRTEDSIDIVVPRELMQGNPSELIFRWINEYRQ